MKDISPANEIISNGSRLWALGSGLLLIILVLIFNPVWAEEAAKPAMKSEAMDYTDYYDDGFKPIDEAGDIEVVPETATTESDTDSSTQANEEPSQDRITEQNLEKSSEFVISEIVELVPVPKSIEVSVRNEYPESLKVIFETISTLQVTDNGSLSDNSSNSVAIYLNAYETIDNITLNQDLEYKVKVYNIYDEYLGYIRNAKIKDKRINISPFLMVQDFAFKSTLSKNDKPKSEQVFTAQKIMDQPLVLIKDTSSIDNNQASVIKSPPQMVAQILDNISFKNEFDSIDLHQLQKSQETVRFPPQRRSIKIANISHSPIHIDIIEPGNRAIGEGWTIPNDLYVPQFLNFQSKPIMISKDANLLITESESKLMVKKKAQELNIDEKGNFIWLINDINLSSNSN